MGADVSSGKVKYYQHFVPRTLYGGPSEGLEILVGVKDYQMHVGGISAASAPLIADTPFTANT